MQTGSGGGKRPELPEAAMIYNPVMTTLTASWKSALRREMEALLGPGGVISDAQELLVYEPDGLTLLRALADFVVFPT